MRKIGKIAIQATFGKIDAQKKDNTFEVINIFSFLD